MKIHDKFFREVFLLDNTRSEMFYNSGYAMYSSCYQGFFFIFEYIEILYRSSSDRPTFLCMYNVLFVRAMLIIDRTSRTLQIQEQRKVTISCENIIY